MPSGMRPTSSRSARDTTVVTSRSVEGFARAVSPSGASERSRQKAFDHTMTIVYSVSSDVMMAPATSTHAVIVPASAPASSRMILPRNPENGGMPPRFRAGIRYSIARIGDAFASPPSLRSEDEPACRSMRPTTRNSAVCTRMWWTM